MFIFVANDAAEDATGGERAGRVLRKDARDVRASRPPPHPPFKGTLKVRMPRQCERKGDREFLKSAFNNV